MRRDVYASREDCLADWGNKPEDCTPSTEKRHQGGGFFLGPLYAMTAMNAMRGGSGSAWTSNNSARPGSRASAARQPPRAVAAAAASAAAASARPATPRRADRFRAARDTGPAPRLAAEGRGARFRTSIQLGGVYWDERACYRFTADEIDVLEAATAELHARCLEAVAARGREAATSRASAFRSASTRWWSARGRKAIPALRPLRPRLRRPRRAEAARVQRRHADRAARSGVVQWYWLQDVHAGRRPVQLASTSG